MDRNSQMTAQSYGSQSQMTPDQQSRDGYDTLPAGNVACPRPSAKSYNYVRKSMPLPFDHSVDRPAQAVRFDGQTYDCHTFQHFLYDMKERPDQHESIMEYLAKHHSGPVLPPPDDPETIQSNQQGSFPGDDQSNRAGSSQHSVPYGSIAANPAASGQATATSYHVQPPSWATGQNQVPPDWGYPPLTAPNRLPGVQSLFPDLTAPAPPQSYYSIECAHGCLSGECRGHGPYYY